MHGAFGDLALDVAMSAALIPLAEASRAVDVRVGHRPAGIGLEGEWFGHPAAAETVE